MRMGLPPVRISLTKSVFRPMAAMARTMKNLLSSLMGAKTEAGIPAPMAMVVMTEAPDEVENKKREDIFKAYGLSAGKIRLFLLPGRIKARHRVMGMMARVLVSFTVTALSGWLPPDSTCCPRWPRRR